MPNLARESSPQQHKLTAPVVHVHRFQPFHGRAAKFPGSYVLALKFRYDAGLTAVLRRELARLKPRVVDPERMILAAGGWLGGPRCWFVEPTCWPEIKQVLERAGAVVREGGEQ